MPVSANSPIALWTQLGVNMVKHKQIKTGVADVVKWLNQHELKAEQVQITFTTNRCSGSYMIFYDSENDKHPELEEKK